ncbi:MAG: hypothetical protein HY692_08945 [Cyanobacteria bacterium NC_groundwater_1444_Ag_S-0.65um_54_12]|nr:hypothetical protein [Cyanobacteria bacterium NC_groundwater_1444_Ag_S-0.65um_54_12]
MGWKWWLLLVAGFSSVSCGSPQKEYSRSFRFVPSPLAMLTPTVSLSGQVFMAQSEGIDPATRLPPAYRPPTPEGTLRIRIADQNITEVPIRAGSYHAEGLPIGVWLSLHASAPGLAPRRGAIILFSDGIFDFKAEYNQEVGLYLVDTPELSELSPDPRLRMDPGKPLALHLTYSEPIDPASLTAEAIALVSRDLPDFHIADGTPLLGVRATVRQIAPNVLLFETHAPLMNAADERAVRVLLDYGQGILKESNSGNVLGGPAKTVASARLPQAEGRQILYHFWPDNLPPRLESVRLLGPMVDGVQLLMSWSEPMTVMQNAGSANGKMGERVLEPSAYRLAVNLDGITKLSPRNYLSELRFEPLEPTTVRALASGSFPLFEKALIMPEGIRDPAGNLATGMVPIRR